MRPLQIAFLPLLCAGNYTSSLLYPKLHFHFTSPTDLLHPSPTQHIKTYHEFFIYEPNFTLLFISCNLFSNLSKDFQQYIHYRTHKCETLTHPVHIPTRFCGGHYHHHGIQIAS